jgi:V8-like Glu-specific endopeptidase
MLDLIPGTNRALAITCAHCVYTSSGVGIGANFVPSAGNAAASGTWSTVSIIRYAQWISGSCFAGPQGDSCRRYDIALIELVPLSGATFIGGSAYGAPSKSVISNAAFRPHVGYPNCGAAGAPAGCSFQTPYEDQAWWVDSFRQSDRLFNNAADASPGHSGGPMFVFFNNVDVVSGVQSGEICSGFCANNSAHPAVNIAVRLTLDMFNTIQTKLGR